MAVLNVQRITQAGLTPAYVPAAGGGDSFLASGTEMVHVKNGSVGSITVTVDGPNVDNFGVTGDDHDLPIAIPAGQERMIKLADVARFRDVNGSIQLTYSGVTSLTVGVFSM